MNKYLSQFGKWLVIGGRGLSSLSPPRPPPGRPPRARKSSSSCPIGFSSPSPCRSTSPRKKAYYRDANLDVDAVFTRGGGENVQAVVSGDAQIGLGTGTLAVISAFVKKAPVKIAAAEITGMDAFWYVQANTPMRKLEDLAGKKVAYSRPGSSSHMAVLGSPNRSRQRD